MAKFSEIMNAGQQRTDPVVLQHAMNDMAKIGPEPQQTQQNNNSPSLVGELGSVWLQGLKDAQNVVLNAFPDSMKGVEEPGTPTNPTQQMVTDAVVGEQRSGPSTGFSLQDILNTQSSPPPQPTLAREEQERGGREM